MNIQESKSVILATKPLSPHGNIKDGEAEELHNGLAPSIGQELLMSD